MGSTHGTILNGGAPINPNAYKRLMAGDSIKFGSSSRTFVFEGGPDREEIVDVKQADPNASRAPASSIDSDVAKPKPKPVGTVVTKPKRRFAPLSSEKPEEEELDAEGRLDAQLTRKRGKGDAEEEEDGGNVSDKERDHAELEMVAGYLGREAIEGADGEDSFFDRTLDAQKSSLMSAQSHKQKVPESYETVSAKIRVLNFVKNAIAERITALDQVIAKDVRRRDSGATGQYGEGEEIDTLDAFLNGMSQTVEEEEERSKKLLVAKTLESELNKLQQLEKQLKPLPNEIHASLVSASDLETLSDEYYNTWLDRVKLAGGPLKLQMKRAAPPEPKRAKIAESDPQATHTSSLPPPSSSVALAEAASSSTRPVSDEAHHTPSPPSSFPMPSPLNKCMSNSDNSSEAQEGASKAPNLKKRERPPSADYGVGPNSDVVWEAPQGQTGDGRTALNDKYGY